MKRLFLVAQFLFLAACTAADPKVPGELVGIWASENAVLKDGKWLMSGQALYLAAGKKPEHTHIVIQEIADEDWGFSGLLTDDWKKQQTK